MISHTAEYALRAVVWLGNHPQRPQTTQQIARGTGIPPGYLSKVLQALAHGGIVRSRRGIRGGFTLGRAPGALSLLDVVAAVDPIRRVERCPLGMPAHENGNFCPLHRRLDQAVAAVEAALRETTVADLVEPSPAPL